MTSHTITFYNLELLIKGMVKFTKSLFVLLATALAIALVVAILYFSSTQGFASAGETIEGSLVIKSVGPDSVVVDVNARWGPAGAMGGDKNKVLKIGETIAIDCDKDATLVQIVWPKAKFLIKKAHEQQCLLL